MPCVYIQIWSWVYLKTIGVVLRKAVLSDLSQRSWLIDLQWTLVILSVLLLFQSLQSHFNVKTEGRIIGLYTDIHIAESCKAASYHTSPVMRPVFPTFLTVLHMLLWMIQSPSLCNKAPHNFGFHYIFLCSENDFFFYIQSKIGPSFSNPLCVPYILPLLTLQIFNFTLYMGIKTIWKSSKLLQSITLK